MMPDKLPRRPMWTVSPSCAVARRLADDAVLKPLAARRERLHDLQRAVVGGAFFVARDQACPTEPASLRIPLGEAAARVDHRREAALHVGGAAADQRRRPRRRPRTDRRPTARAARLGTTSVCPAKTSAGAARPRRAQRLSTSPNFSGSVMKPAVFASSSAISCWQPASAGRYRRPADQLAREAQSVHAVEGIRPIRCWLFIRLASTRARVVSVAARPSAINP